MTREPTIEFECHCLALRRDLRGFTLVELLVVIVIILVLASLSVVGITHARLAAAKATTVEKMRQIAVGVTTWAAEKNNGEPFYVANGTGDYGHEGRDGSNPKLAPGNPAMLLYDRDSPVNGYVTDHTLFFCPLVDGTPPDRLNYHPENADKTNVWGTYTWYYPSTTTLTERQRTATGGAYLIPAVSRAADKKLMMAPDYTNRKPKWDEIYFALMIDGSVTQVASTKAAFEKWRTRN